MLSTWSFGHTANMAGYPPLLSGSDALSCVLAGAVAVENDPAVDSVGIGGLPDSSGRVSLDACVMLSPSENGGVCAIRNFANPSLIARAVMEKTVHSLLAGPDAEVFAAGQGMLPHPAALLTRGAQAQFDRYLVAKALAQPTARLGTLPPMNVEERYATSADLPHPRAAGAKSGPSENLAEPMHDTVCVLAQDAAGKLAGVVTTSGLGFKLAGRVGDSPIIGHGLYVDPAVGAVAATGNGELIMSVCGSFLANEYMRQGRWPIEALAAVLDRITSCHTLLPQHQVALIALRADGAWASASLRRGFRHCISESGATTLQHAMHIHTQTDAV